MSYGKVIAIGLALVALAWLDNEAGEKQRNWEEKNKEYEDEIDRLNNELIDILETNNQYMDFKELIDLHYQSFSTADRTKLLLEDANTSLKAIGQTIMTLKENKKEVENQIYNEIDKNKKKEYKEELSSIISTRKMLFSNQDNIKEQRNSLSKKLKEFNSNTRKLKLAIRDNTGQKGRDWYNRLEKRIEQKNNPYQEKNNGGCFLSTACINNIGLPDNCYELEILRNFRDTYVPSLDKGIELITDYYQNSPKILVEISKSKNENDILNQMYTSIHKIIQYILLGENQKAFNSYVEIYQDLKIEYLKG